MNRRSGEISRQHILDSARRVFAESGYAGASMRMIASRAGMSVGNLYLYFRNKDDLYLTLMQEWMENLKRMTEETLLRLDEPLEALKQFISAVLEFASGNREMITMQGKEFGFQLAQDCKQRFSAEQRGILTRIIAAGQEAAVFTPGNPEGKARVIFNTLRGYGISLVVDESSLFTVEECLSLVVDGLSRRNT